MSQTPEQKTAIVTGAARGIGLATTKQFLAEGRRVAMIDRDSEALKAEAGALENVLPVVCDVSQPEQVDDLGVLQADNIVGSQFETLHGPFKVKFRQTLRYAQNNILTFIAIVNDHNTKLIGQIFSKLVHVFNLARLCPIMAFYVFTQNFTWMKGQQRGHRAGRRQDRHFHHRPGPERLPDGPAQLPQDP